jgi:hypothetical protein
LTSTDLAPTGPGAVMSGEEFDQTWRLAQAFAASGMFPDAKQAAEAFTKVILGRSLGLSPAQAMMGLHVVKGRPQVAAVMLGRFLILHGYSYRIVEHTDEVCRIEFRGHDGEVLGESSFSMDDAKRAKLVRGDSPWQTHPRNMLFARAMSNGVKWFAPDATGGVPVYHEGEIEQEVVRDQLVNGERGALPVGPVDTDALERMRRTLEDGVDETVAEAHDGTAEEDLPGKLDEREQEPDAPGEELDEKERDRRRHIEADRKLAEEG